MLKKIIVLSLSILLVSFSVSIVLKCAIGVGAWDAFSQTASGIINIKVGTFSMFMNISCVVAQMLIRKEIKITLILQVFLAVSLGVLINFFYYQLFEDWQTGSYLTTMIFFLIGNVSCAFGVGTVTAQNFISFPLEGLCMEIASKLKRPFGKIRQLADIITMIGVLILVLLFDGIMTIREGTVIGMIVFGPLLDLYMTYIKPIMIKKHIF
ncbi:MAG: hypothetical protein PHP11_02845 [Erysipelotrichaceae bacterium]|nr:hypothetical protein [Erysipelotrichaceae bacterium]